MSKSKKVEIKIELDASKLEEVLTENQKLAEKLPDDPGPPPEPVVPNADPEEEKVKDSEWKDPLRPFKPYAIGKDMLTIHKFQPICNRRFIFALPGLDAFLVKRVERHPYIRPKGPSWQDKKTDRELLEELNAHKKLVVYLHDVIAPSTRQQIEEILDANQVFATEAKVKILDPVGTVISELTYSDVVVERVDYDPLDYADGRSSAEIKLTLSYRKEKLEF